MADTVISGSHAATTFAVSPFESEGDFCQFLEQNMGAFIAYALGDELVSYEREARFQPGCRGPRVDFRVVGKDYKYLIECKNPNQLVHELTRSLSQLLHYGYLAGDDYKLVLATTRYTADLSGVIAKYRLPITVCVVSEDALAVLIGNQEREVACG